MYVRRRDRRRHGWFWYDTYMRGRWMAALRPSGPVDRSVLVGQVSIIHVEIATCSLDCSPAVHPLLRRFLCCPLFFDLESPSCRVVGPRVSFASSAPFARILVPTIRHRKASCPLSHRGGTLGRLDSRSAVWPAADGIFDALNQGQRCRADGHLVRLGRFRDNYLMALWRRCLVGMGPFGGDDSDRLKQSIGYLPISKP